MLYLKIILTQNSIGYYTDPLRRVCITNCKNIKKIFISYVSIPNSDEFNRVPVVYENSLKLRRYNQALCLEACPTGFKADAVSGECKIEAPNFENLDSQINFPSKRDSIEESYKVTQDCSTNGVL